MTKPASISSLPLSTGPRTTQNPPAGAHACAGCHKAHHPDDCFCSHCGQDLENTSVPADGVDAPTPRALGADSADAVTGTADEESAANERHSGAGGASTSDPHSPFSCACGQVLPRTARFCLQCGLPVPCGAPQVRLRQVADGSPVGAWDLDRDTVTIGAAADCEVVVAADPYVSRHHARLARVDDHGFVLEDLGSANGTLLRVRRPIPLEMGDEIVLGTTVLRLEQPA